MLCTVISVPGNSHGLLEVMSCLPEEEETKGGNCCSSYIIINITHLRTDRQTSMSNTKLTTLYKVNPTSKDAKTQKTQSYLNSHSLSSSRTSLNQ